MVRQGAPPAWEDGGFLAGGQAGGTDRGGDHSRIGKVLEASRSTAVQGGVNMKREKVDS